MNLFPYNNQFHTQSDGHRMSFLSEGPASGQPVVMVHGNPTWSFYYRRMVDALKGEFRCLVPDHIGMGLSDRPSDEHYVYTLQSRLDDFGHWLDAVEPERPIDLIVHDWGGAIGLSWAARHPERIRRIVILNTWAFNIPKHESLPRSLKFARTHLGGFLINRFNAFSGLATRMATAKKLDPEVAKGLVAPYQKGPKSRLATLRFVQDIPLKESDPAWSVLADTENLLHQLADKPVEIHWGGKDFVFNDKVLDIWRERLPNAHITYHPDAGHYVLEDAHTEIIPKVQQFLKA